MKRIKGDYYYYNQNLIKQENFNEIENNNELVKQLVSTHGIYSDTIYRGVIHVTNKCNLSCSYCYANKGNYGSENKVMSISTAMDIAEFINKYHINMNVVHFFGGEPLLNLDVIEYLCEKLTPRKFTLISNGTILNDKFIELILKHKIDLIISIDGPEALHNANRKFPTGQGSYELIMKNLKELKQKTGQPKSIEGTITPETLQQISLKELYLWILDNLNIQLVHYPIVSLSEYYVKKVDMKKITEQYIELIDLIFDRLTIDKPEKTILNYFIISILTDFVHKFDQKYICPAGNTTIAINHRGELYPCFMMNNKEKFKLGSIYDYSSKDFTDKRLNFIKKLKKSSIFEESIWYLPAYFNCAAAVYEENRSFKPNISDLKFFEIIFSEILSKLIDIKNEPQKYQNMISNIKYINTTYRHLYNE